MSREAMKLALEAFEAIPEEVEGWIPSKCTDAIIALKQALEQPEPELVALVEKFSLLLWDYQELERAFEKATGGKWIRKSNTPQRKPWAALMRGVRVEGETVVISVRYGNGAARGLCAALIEEMNRG